MTNEIVINYLCIIREHSHSKVTLPTFNAHLVFHPLDVILPGAVVLQFLLDFLSNLQGRKIREHHFFRDTFVAKIHMHV